MTFLDDPNVDIYISTWDKTIYSNKKIGLYIEESVTEEQVRADLGRPAVIRIDGHRSLIEKKYNSRMINRWVTGFELIRDSGVEYDYVMVVRPDIFFNRAARVDLLEIQKYQNSIGFAWATSLHLDKLPDVLFVASYSNMRKLFDSLTVDIWATDPTIDWHSWWYQFVNGIFPEIQDASELSYFSFCRMWAKENDTFTDILNIHHDWRDLRLLRECDMWGDDFAATAWPSHVLPAAREKWNNGYFDKYKSNNI